MHGGCGNGAASLERGTKQRACCCRSGAAEASHVPLCSHPPCRKWTVRCSRGTLLRSACSPAPRNFARCPPASARPSAEPSPTPQLHIHLHAVCPSIRPQDTAVSADWNPCKFNSRAAPPPRTKPARWEHGALLRMHTSARCCKHSQESGRSLHVCARVLLSHSHTIQLRKTFYELLGWKE
jgi:hypothetical protein